MTIYQHIVGDVRPTLKRIIDAYPSTTAAAEAIGITRELTYRILRSADACGVAKRNVEKIMNHKIPEAEATPFHVKPKTVIEYARTPEGRRFIDLCRDGSVAA